MATAEFSKFAGMLSAALLQHHLVVCGYQQMFKDLYSWLWYHTEYFLCPKNYLHDQDNHDGVITHLEPDILECEVKWALASITMNKASGGDGIPVELFFKS